MEEVRQSCAIGHLGRLVTLGVISIFSSSPHASGKAIRIREGNVIGGRLPSLTESAKRTDSLYTVKRVYRFSEEEGRYGINFGKNAEL